MSDLKDETLRRAQELADFKLLSSGDIPKIDLYMEQVTSCWSRKWGRACAARMRAFSLTR